MTTQQRYIACLMGLAVGDALGVPGEFKPRGSYPKITEMIGGGPFRLKPGEWTDDTSMALCIGKSLIDKGELSPPDVMEKFWNWVEAGYMSSNGRMFDIGDTTSEALCYYRKHGNNSLAGLETSTDNKKSGNGSIMRLAPVPMFFKDDHCEAAWMDMAVMSSMLTHGSLNCMGSCAYLSRLICGALNGMSKEEILNPDFFMKNEFVQGVLNNTHKQDFTPEVIDIAMGAYKTKTIDEIKSTGYVIHTLEAAVWCFHTTDSFEEGCIKAVNLGEDTDTVGAVYGQLAGAYYGITPSNGIPARWLDKIVLHDIIIDVADKLYQKRKT